MYLFALVNTRTMEGRIIIPQGSHRRGFCYAMLKDVILWKCEFVDKRFILIYDEFRRGFYIAAKCTITFFDDYFIDDLVRRII